MIDDPQRPIAENPAMAHRLSSRHRSNSLSREATQAAIWGWRALLLLWAIVAALEYPYRDQGNVRLHEFVFEGEVIRREVMAIEFYSGKRRHSIYSTGVLVRKRGLDTQWAKVFPEQQNRKSAETDAVYKKNAAALLTLKNGDRATLNCMGLNYGTSCILIEAANARGEKLVAFDRAAIRQDIRTTARSEAERKRRPFYIAATLIGFELLRTLCVFLWRKATD